jgi:hypothetical protein
MWERHDTNRVKIFASRIAIAAAVVVVAGMGWYGLKRYKDARTAGTKLPNDGSLNGNVYTNDFFQFTVQFPAGWKVLNVDSGPQVDTKATSYLLLLVGNPDSRMHGTRWITIVAAQPPASSAPLSNAEDVAKREADALMAVSAMDPNLGKTFRLSGGPSQISIAGKRMARLDITGQVKVQGKDYDFVSSQLAIIERGYLVMFVFTDPKGQESEREAARKAMDSMHFFGKKN